jgi:hypothetical protein
MNICMRTTAALAGVSVVSRFARWALVGALASLSTSVVVGCGNDASSPVMKLPRGMQAAAAREYWRQRDSSLVN